MVINIIGDSHALTFDGAEDVKVHWLGAQTAHNLSKRQEELECIVQTSAHSHWFLFGEIDCRIHFYKMYMESKQPLEKLIRKTVTNYLETISKLSIYPHAVGVMEIPPQGMQGNIFAYPHYGSREERQNISDEFNTYLCEGCSEYDIPFIEVYSFSGRLWPEEDFKDDKCHLKNEVAINKLEAYIDTNR